MICYECQCGKLYRLADNFAGKLVRCETCLTVANVDNNPIFLIGSEYEVADIKQKVYDATSVVQTKEQATDKVDLPATHKNQTVSTVGIDALVLLGAATNFFCGYLYMDRRHGTEITPIAVFLFFFGVVLLTNLVAVRTDLKLYAKYSQVIGIMMVLTGLPTVIGSVLGVIVFVMSGRMYIRLAETKDAS